MCSRSIGDYLLLQSIGKGAFSEVFLAEHQPTKTYAAVKQIPKDSSYVRDHLDQLKTEISMMKQCNHPYIAKFYEIMEDDYNIYIAQEYVEHGNIRHYFNSNEDIEEHIIKKLFIQVLYAVDYLHNDIRIIHRDLKMENILLDKNNNIRIIDFGLCCPIPDDNVISYSSLNGGSPAYLAPEMILGLPYTKSVDIWALGIILYAMTHTCLPFDDPNVNRLFRKIISLNANCRRDLNPQIADLIGKMLNKDPKKRITFSDIFEHPWIAPSLSLYNPKTFISSIDSSHIFNKLHDLGYSTDTVKKALDHNDNTKGVIIYSILYRNLVKRALSRITELGSPTQQRSIPSIPQTSSDSPLNALLVEEKVEPRSAKDRVISSPLPPKAPHSCPHPGKDKVKNLLTRSLKQNVRERKCLSSMENFHITPPETPLHKHHSKPELISMQFGAKTPSPKKSSLILSHSVRSPRKSQL